MVSACSCCGIFIPMFARCLALSLALLGGLVQPSVVLGAVDPSKLPPAAGGRIDFKRDVQPLLEAKCYKCHGPQRSENGLRFDDRQSALRGGERGPAIVPGKGSESVLIHAVAGARDDLEIGRAHV